MGLKDYFVNKMLASFERSDQEKLSGKPLCTGVIAESDISYAGDFLRGHLLDVYRPAAGTRKLPVLIDIHGGGFMSSYKELDRLFGFHMAKRGFLVFNVNYRLALSGIKVTDQIRDISTAVKWIDGNLNRFGGDRENVFICGHSAGAVLAVIEALNSKSARLRKIFNAPDNCRLQYKGLVLDCGMMTFYQNTVGYWGMRTMVFEKEYWRSETYRNMIWKRVPEFSSLPKIFLISNKKDELKDMTLKFKDILDKSGVENKMDFQTDLALGHCAIIYDPDSEACSGIIDRVVAYILK